jgi:predicted dehydrogenase
MGEAPLRIGIAGANMERGWARDAHLPALRTLPGLAIHAVSARTREIAEAAASGFGAARAYDDSLALARDPEIDIVAVTVKVPEHRAIILAALDAGKHVYCEWPLARDAAEADEQAEAACRAGTHVAIGLQGAQAPAVAQAARLVREGAIGRPLNLRVVSATAGWGDLAPPHYAYLQDRRNGATLTTIAGGHTLAMVAAVVGTFEEIGACASILRDRVELAGTGETVARTCADHLLIHARHPGGCVSSIEIAGGDASPLRFELRGTQGRLEITGDHPGGYQCAALSVTAPGARPDPVPAGLQGAAINVAGLWRRFEQDIRSGERSVADFAMAAKLHRLIDAIETASDEGRNLTPCDAGMTAWEGRECR